MLAREIYGFIAYFSLLSVKKALFSRRLEAVTNTVWVARTRQATLFRPSQFQHSNSCDGVEVETQEKRAARLTVSCTEKYRMFMCCVL